ncbi:MAG: hypothetical protein FWE71_05505 [Nocardioidaceae bacterium]|nr:hypothetical protein [Nocardioidaceae bacterium]MCL2611999.1 hypothetical protein [Nocardioidaceae bacterium]
MSVIDIKMSAIYQASHDELPSEAGIFSAEASGISDAIDPLVRQVALAGNHPIGPDLADLAVELFLHLRSMVRTFNDSATGLDLIADDFVRQDEQAKAWLDQNRRYLGDPQTATLPTAPTV